MSVSGAVELSRRFVASAGAVASALPDALDKSALIVTRSAKYRAPVDTGFLRGSILPHRVSATEADVVSHAEYSIYNEVGTSKMAAHPYMRPALDENKPEIERIIGQSVVLAIRGVSASGGSFGV